MEESEDVCLDGYIRRHCDYCRESPNEAKNLVALLRSQAEEISNAGHDGWGNTMRWAADVLSSRSPKPEIEAIREREMDLIRYCRHLLLDERLITEAEFAALSAIGPDAVQRLEDYDSLRAQLDRVRASVSPVAEAQVDQDELAKPETAPSHSPSRIREDKVESADPLAEQLLALLGHGFTLTHSSEPYQLHLQFKTMGETQKAHSLLRAFAEPAGTLGFSLIRALRKLETTQPGDGSKITNGGQLGSASAHESESSASATAKADGWEKDASEIVSRLRTVPDVDIAECCERHAMDEIIEVLARRAVTDGRDAGLEEAARIVCFRCAESQNYSAAQFMEGMGGTEPSGAKDWRHTDPRGFVHYCRAANIRARIGKPEKEDK